jgi:DNA recombination protein RmuC
VSVGLLSAICILLVVLALLFFLQNRRLLKELKAPRQPDSSFLLLQQQVHDLQSNVRSTLDGNTQIINQQLGQLSSSVLGQLGQVTSQVNEQLRSNLEMLRKTNQTLGERLDNASAVVGQVQTRLGQLDEANKRIFEVGKDITRLQELLRAPKFRGSLGELFLADLLAQILPPQHYGLQHEFRTGTRVDAVVRLGPKLVPVDAKFPLESFRRVVEAPDDEGRRAHRKSFVADVKRHIDAVGSKYILPDEGTFDFALMYIPAENVYYEAIIKDESFAEEKGLFSYALERRVIPVSPNSSSRNGHRGASTGDYSEPGSARH